MKVKKPDGSVVQMGTPSKTTDTTAPVVIDTTKNPKVKAAERIEDEKPKVDATQDEPYRLGQLVPQLSDDQLADELEYTTAENFVKKHTDNMDANIDAMARVLRLEPYEIRDIQRELGYPIPDGA